MTLRQKLACVGLTVFGLQIASAAAGGAPLADRLRLWLDPEQLLLASVRMELGAPPVDASPTPEAAAALSAATPAPATTPAPTADADADEDAPTTTADGLPIVATSIAGGLSIKNETDIAVDAAALLQQRGRIDRDVRLVFDAQPARDARRHDRQPVGRRGGRVLVGVGVRGGGGCRGRRGRGRAERRCRLRCGGCVHRRRTQLHAHRCQQQLLRVEPEPQPVRERRAARRSRCDLQAEHGQPHAGQFLPQRHICSPPIAFSTIYMVSGVELCHRICYTEHRNISKEASS